MKAAAVAYRPIGRVGGMAGGLIAGVIFKQGWKKVSGTDDAPGATPSEYGWGEVLLASAIQGAIYAVVKATIDRAGAQAWARSTGEWPGD